MKNTLHNQNNIFTVKNEKSEISGLKFLAGYLFAMLEKVAFSFQLCF